ncbi:MAG: hypothetical protein NZ899_10040 [Thermoguttaceae bacterium]|nr:hypothetical protein [Thermoguttaceae bacterium]MDW8078027.1 hypothetical protein [Thermoguttaceae bacterium]
MIRYVCDLCGREIDPEEDSRFVVLIEVRPALRPPTVGNIEEEIDHLEELQRLLENLDDSQLEQPPAEVTRKFRFDLCASCRERFVKEPLGREARKIWQFSKN